MKLLSSVCFAYAIYLVLCDFQDTANRWKWAALVPPKPGSPNQTALRKLRDMWYRLLRMRSDSAQWEEVAVSLAFHIRAGQTPSQAVRDVAGSGTSPVHQRLMEAYKAYEAGASLIEAIRQASGPSWELGYLAGILEIGISSGGDLPSLLCHAADWLRQRRLLNKEILSKTSEARLTALILSVLPWIITAFIWGNDRTVLIGLISDPRGKVLAASAFVVWLAGIGVVTWLLVSVKPWSPPPSSRAPGQT